MNTEEQNGAIVFAKNCENNRSYFYCPHPIRAPPAFFESTKISKNQEEKNMHYDAAATGLRIQQLRKSVDMTLEELGEQLNVTDRQVRRIEKGESNGSIDLLVEVSVIFHVSLDYLILGKVSDRSDLKKILQQAISYLSELEQYA